MSPLIKKENPGAALFHFSSIYRGTLVSLGISVGLSIVAGLTYYFTSLSENTMSWVAASILFLSVASGSAYAAKRARSRGLFNGLGVGVITFIVLWLISGIILPGSVLLAGALGKLALTLAAGSLGGMIGVAVAS